MVLEFPGSSHSATIAQATSKYETICFAFAPENKTSYIDYWILAVQLSEFDATNLFL